METAKKGKGEKFYAYFPAIVASALTVLTTALYATIIEIKYWTVYCSLAIMMFVPFIVTWVNRKWSLGLPQYLIALMCSHAVVSVDMGTAMGLYSRIPWWDAAVHCYFGFLACATLYYLFSGSREEPLKLLDLIVIVLLVISFAAIWEVYEFVAGEILGCDMQDVGLLLSQGANPLTDTMSDIVVAAVGAVIFEIGAAVVKQIAKAREKKLARGQN